MIDDEDADLLPYLRHAEKVLALESFKKREDCESLNCATRKYLVAEAMIKEYERISRKRRQIRLAKLRAKLGITKELKYDSVSEDPYKEFPFLQE